MAVAGPSRKEDICIQWDMLSPTGPQVAYHASCILANSLYIHGGIRSKIKRDPLSQLYKMDLNSRIWQEVRAPNCPGLSHHACLPLEDRYMFLIGGWDGRVRSTQVYAYDTQEEKWLFPRTTGFPEGGGLSSHTAIQLADGKILVIGREGSARMQRRFGNAFMLTGSISQGSFTWSDSPLSVDSRSGHSTHIIGNTLITIGGRSDKPTEIHGGFKTGKPQCAFMKQMAAIATSLTPMTKPPCGRTHHVAIEGAGVVLVHGGETFDGKSRDPVPELYLLKCKPHIQWLKLGTAPVARAGHTLAYRDEVVIIHGGEGAKANIYGDTYQIKILN